MGAETPNDVAVLDNWRASHLYIINTFQSSLRARRKRIDSERSIAIAQRLKRRPTIIDKLSREPGMSLSRMHDIAGCRLIFENVDLLQEFRAGVLESKAAHEHVGEGNRYDYISTPKPSGYRGVHDVYKYKVGSPGGEKWNGLRLELQYRTVIQHAWSTAVEISDIVNATRLKFSDANTKLTRLFVLCSELLSRIYEGMDGPCPGITNEELEEELDDLENELHAIGRLRNLTSGAFRDFARTSKLFILINFTSGDREGEFAAEGFFDNASAVKRYAELELEYQSTADVVLVGSSQQDTIKLAYTNYFSDASTFIKLVDDARAGLAGMGLPTDSRALLTAHSLLNP